MKLLADLDDLEYKKHGYTHTRNTVRAIVLNDKDEIGMLHIVGEDFFGKRNHYETPGGGIEANEPYEKALKREILEELGYTCEVISEVGMIISRYNLIMRINVSRFYVVKLLEKKKLHRTDEEEMLIFDVVFKPLEWWLETISKGDNPVDRLVHKRELIALNAFKTQIREG